MWISAPQAPALPDGPGLQFPALFCTVPQILTSPPVSHTLAVHPMEPNQPVSNKTTLFGVPPCISATWVAKTANFPCPIPSQFQLHTLSAV